MQIQGLSLQCVTTWHDVFQRWLEGEGSHEDWQNIARGKGWESWREWRSTWAKNFNVQERRWFCYVLNSPLEIVPHFRVGPAQSWQNHFLPSERNMHTFSVLIERTSLYETNEKVLSFLERFPSPTEFIGICMPDESIVLLEGHHRATALSLAARTGLNVSFNKLPTIALTHFNKGEEVLLDIALEKGSAKNI